MTVPIWLQNTTEVEWRRVRTVVTNQSPFTGQAFQSSYLDSRWVARINYADMDRAEAAPLLAAIAAQRDGIGTIKLWDPDFGIPQSGFTGAGEVLTTPAFGATVIASHTWTPNTLLARPGDKLFIGVDATTARMCEVTADVTSNVSGVANISIDELPGVIPVAGSFLAFDWVARNAGVPMRLVSYQKQSLPGARFRISVEAEERV